MTARYSNKASAYYACHHALRAVEVDGRVEVQDVRSPSLGLVVRYFDTLDQALCYMKAEALDAVEERIASLVASIDRKEDPFHSLTNELEYLLDMCEINYR